MAKTLFGLLDFLDRNLVRHVQMVCYNLLSSAFLNTDVNTILSTNFGPPSESRAVAGLSVPTSVRNTLSTNTQLLIGTPLLHRTPLLPLPPFRQRSKPLPRYLVFSVAIIATYLCTFLGPC